MLVVTQSSCCKICCKMVSVTIKKEYNTGKISSGENNFFSQIDLLYIKVLIEKEVSIFIGT